jgi:hypothetical protein
VQVLKINGCTGSHPPWLCIAFGDKTHEERSRIIEDNKFCPFCQLRSAEEVCYSKTYKTKPVCSVPECKELHSEWLHQVMHSLPCKKEASVGSINRVCESKIWKTSEDL